MTTLKQRRNFLKQAVALGSGVAMMTTPFALSRAFAGGNLDNSGYKALVCLDLDGGNDGTNMIVPNTDAAYTDYKKVRNGLAIARKKLLAINPKGMADGYYGLHPALPAVQQLFNNGDAAILANVGPLVSAQGIVGKTPKRGSHSNQRQLWHGLNPQYMASNKQGWMGRLADIASVDSSSVGGKNLWQVGVQTDSAPFVMGRTGPLAFTANSPSLDALVNELAEDAKANQHALLSAHAEANLAARELSAEKHSQLFGSTVNDVIASLNVAFPKSSLGDSFQTTLRSILARDLMGMARQSFYIRLGGFDFHANHLERQQNLLKQVNAAVYAFQSALKQLNLEELVTTFTVSDFGRTSTENGTGTAHGWGNHHFIIGGAVKGRRIYGDIPVLEPTLSSDHLTDDKGILIPAIAVDQYAATLATWFGVAEHALPSILPHISLFNDEQNLGFMR